MAVKAKNFKCIKELEFGQVINQPTQKCIKNKPKTLKICNSRKCYHHDKINKIFQSNSIDALAKLSFDAPKCFDGKILIVNLLMKNLMIITKL